MDEWVRPERDVYYMKIAQTVRLRANCVGRKVGAILVRDDRVISTGYNGTPAGMTNCMDGGCHRCSNKKGYASGRDYDICICVHAEQNAILAAARFGNALDGSVIYSTLRPCFSCLKESLQAGVRAVRYLDDLPYDTAELKQQYENLEREFDSIQQINVTE